jgi:hypothetical protein
VTRWIRPVLAAAVAAAVLAGSILGIQHLRADSAAPPAGNPSVSVTKKVPAPQPSPTDITAANPDEVSGNFVNDQDGWILTTRSNCNGCVSLSSTTDGGGHWSALPNPPAEPNNSADFAGSPEVSFTDPLDGILYGGGKTWVSHDGGRSWIVTAPREVSQVVATGGYVYAVANRGVDSSTDSGHGDSGDIVPTIWRSKAGTTAWSKISVPKVPAGTTTQSWSLAAEAGTLVLLRTGDSFYPERESRGGLWSSTDDGASWQPRTVPCSVTDEEAAVVTIATGHPKAWLLDCFTGTGVQQEMSSIHHLYGTADGGLHWVRLSDPSSNGFAALLADNGAGHAFLATVSGGYDAVLGSTDGAARWHQSVTSSPSGGYQGWADLQFTSSSVGFVLEENPSTDGILYRTTDGGVSWQKRTVPHATQ